MTEIKIVKSKHKQPADDFELGKAVKGLLRSGYSMAEISIKANKSIDVLTKWLSAYENNPVRRKLEEERRNERTRNQNR